MPNQNKTPQPGKTGEGRRRRRRPRGGSGAKSSQGAAQNTAQQAVKPAAQNAAAHPAQNAPQPRSRRPVEEDPGLPLIARRPPKQKFANFEEYLAAHGGVTAPVEGAEEAPALPEGEA